LVGEADNPGGMCNAGFGDKNILACDGCAHFNQEVRDNFKNEGRDAG